MLATMKVWSPLQQIARLIYVYLAMFWSCCEKSQHKRRLLATLYYAISSPGVVINEYFSEPATGSQYSAYFPRTDAQGASLRQSNASFFYNGSVLINNSTKSTVLETVSYKNRAGSFSATGQYTQQSGSIETEVPVNTFAITSGLGKFKHARYAVIEYNNTSPLRLRTVRIYA